MLRATGKAVTAETTLAVTAAMVQELGMQNVVLQHGDFDKSANDHSVLLRKRSLPTIRTSFLFPPWVKKMKLPKLWKKK